MVSSAASYYKATLAVTTGLSAPFSNLAVIYKQQVVLWCFIFCFCFDTQWMLESALFLCFQYLMSIIFLLQGNYIEAISCYNEVLRIDPLAADGLVNRGNTYKEIGRVSEAIQDYIRAINIRPTMAEAHANLASAYKDR